MADKDLGIRIFFSIPGVIFCLLSILFLSAEDLGNRIGGVRTDANTLFPFMLLIFGMVFVGGGIYSLASRIYVVTAGEHVTAKIEGFKSWTDELTTTNPLQNSDGINHFFSIYGSSKIGFRCSLVH